MFQISMSHIHADSRYERYDTDSSVGHIEDGLVAIEAFQMYLAKLSESYGITFRFDATDTDERTILRARADMTDMHGDALIEVELQRPEPQSDPAHIVELMRVKAKYTFLQHPA